MERLLGNLHWILLLSGCLGHVNYSYSQAVKKSGFTSSEVSHAHTPVRPLTVGDKVPDLVIDKLINSNSPRLKFSDFKGKLVIVDFWATFCGPCIAAFPKMQSLIRQFGEKLEILAVTAEPRKKVESFLKNNKIGKQMVSLPIVYEDTVLSKYFEFKVVPHEVWIDGDGYVVAITSHEYVTKENIQDILDGKKVGWPVKVEREISGENPRLFFATGQKSKQESNLNEDFYSGLTGYRHGLTTGKFVKYDSNNNITRYNLYNTPILNLYALAYGQYQDFLNPKRSVLNVSNRSHFVYWQGNGYLDEWYSENSYCYETVLRGQWKDEQIREKMKRDLDLFLGLRSNVEKRKVRCLVLKLGDTNLIRRSFDQLPLSEFVETSEYNTRYIQHNSSLHYFVYFLNNHKRTASLPLILDETGYDLPIDLELNLGRNPDDQDVLIKELRRHGLNIVAEKREIEMLIVDQIQISRLK